MYLLDSHVVSELRRGHKADGNVIRWFKQHVDRPVFISAITLMELEIGVKRVEHRDAAQGKLLRQWLDVRVKPRFADNCLPIDTQVALCCAGLHVPDPRSDRDALIAATALVHHLLARRFAAAGQRIALLSRDQNNVEQLAADLDGARGFACDVSDAASIAQAFAEIRAQLGPVTTLLYNAGSILFGTVDNVDPADFELAWRVSAKGLLECTQQVLGDMRAAGGGNIVVTGATASLRGGANFTAFAAAKAAQRSLAQSMARTLWSQNIHVGIAIVDGIVDSPRTRSWLPDAIAESIFQLTRQPRSAWTFELDLRPFSEDW